MYFTPQASTPNIVYYQSSNGAFVGGIINIVDSATSSGSVSATIAADTFSGETPLPTASSGVVALGGNPGPNALKYCVFPFIYNNVTYHNCTCATLGQPWCSLTSNYNANGYYGYCQGYTIADCAAPAAAGSILTAPLASMDSQPQNPSLGSPSSSGTASSSGLSSGAVIGIAVAALALVATVTMAVVHANKQRSSAARYKG